MPVRHTIALLRELDPALDRVPAPRSGRSRRSVPRLAVVAASAAVAVAVGLGTGGSGSAPSFAEAAHAALTPPGHILHLRMRAEFLHPVDRPSSVELWMSDGGQRLRVAYDGGESEFVRDTERRFAASYVRHRDLITVHSDPALWQVGKAEPLSYGGPEGTGRLVGDLPALLARARDGDPAIRRLPDDEVAGRPAARLAVSAVISADPPPASEPPLLEPVTLRTVVWFDLDTHLPMRVERFLGDRRESITEVTLAEQLPIEENAEPPTAMPPRPDAGRVVAP